MSHFKAKHKTHKPTEGKSLLDMGFTALVAREAGSLPLDEDLETEEHPFELVVVRTEQPLQAALQQQPLILLLSLKSTCR
jgi:hypothetical protein